MSCCNPVLVSETCIYNVRLCAVEGRVHSSFCHIHVLLAEFMIHTPQ
jgi:hypothetical protein